MQNAARAMVTGNRPYTSFSGQRIADYNSGFGQANGIMSALQTGGPSNYNQTQFSTAAPYSQTQFQQGSGYNPVSFNPVNFQQGQDYNAPTYNTSPLYQGIGSYSATAGGNQYTPQTIAPREFSQAELDKYMSPYVSGVIDASVDRANIQHDRNQAVNRLKDARGGNYGSYGFRVGEAVRDAEHNRNVNELVRTGLESGFNNATGLMQSWRDAALQADNMTMNDRQFGAGINMQDRQFGHTSDMNDAQFAATMASNNARELNELRQRDAQFGATMSADERNRLNQLEAEQAQFGAQFRSGESQFAANLGAQERQQLNELMARENQFGANFNADQIRAMNELRARENQFGATFGLDARDQFYNQQTGIASYMNEEANRRMQWEQAGLDTQYQDFLEDRDWDQNQVSWLTSVLYGVPGSVQNNYQNIYSNPLAQGLGAVGAIAGLANRGTSG